MEQFQTEKSYDELLKLPYLAICEYYVKKYGHPPKDYFVNDSFRTISSNNHKIKEGLIIHHIDEDKVINLAKKDIAKKHFFTYQQKERLIYCNYLERLLLYMKILENDLHQKSKNIKVVKDKINEFIIPELNDMFSGIEYRALTKKYALKAICTKKANYLLLLNYLIHKLHYDQPLLTSYNLPEETHFLSANLKLYEEIIDLGLNLKNERVIWKDFFFSIVIYGRNKKDGIGFLIDWLWNNFYSQIKKSTNKEKIFKDFLWYTSNLFLIEHEPVVWQGIIAVMFGIYSDNSDEKKIDVINQISSILFKELKKIDKSYNYTYEEEKESFFGYMGQIEEEEKAEGIKNYKRSVLEKEMEFLTSLITWWAEDIHDIRLF